MVVREPTNPVEAITLSAILHYLFALHNITPTTHIVSIIDINVYCTYYQFRPKIIHSKRVTILKQKRGYDVKEKFLSMCGAIGYTELLNCTHVP